MEINEPDEMAFMSLYVPFTQLCSWWLQLFIMEFCLVSFLQTGRGFVDWDIPRPASRCPTPVIHQSKMT